MATHDFDIGDRTRRRLKAICEAANYVRLEMWAAEMDMPAARLHVEIKGGDQVAGEGTINEAVAAVWRQRESLTGEASR